MHSHLFKAVQPGIGAASKQSNFKFYHFNHFAVYSSVALGIFIAITIILAHAFFLSYTACLFVLQGPFGLVWNQIKNFFEQKLEETGSLNFQTGPNMESLFFLFPFPQPVLFHI